MKQFGETPPKMDVHSSKTKKFRETSLEKCSVPAIVFETATKPTHLAHLCEGAQIHGDPWRLPRKTTSECQKVVRDLHATAACIFARLNFQKCSDAEVLLTFLLRQCGSRHGSVQVSISHPTRWLHAGSFSEPTFRPSAARKHWKNRVFRDFSTFSHTLIFLLTLSCLTFPSTVATPFHRSEVRPLNCYKMPSSYCNVTRSIVTSHITGWWFGTFFIFPYIGNNNPNSLIFFQRGWNHQLAYVANKII